MGLPPTPGTRALRPTGGGPVLRPAGRRVQERLPGAETSHPPTWYVAPADVVDGAITRSRARSTMCEWKGAATYWDVRGVEAAAWSYEDPTPGFELIRGYLAFSPATLECEVDGERVRPQEGGFYGGWVTDDVVGPFKGGAGTWGW